MNSGLYRHVQRVLGAKIAVDTEESPSSLQRAFNNKDALLRRLLGYAAHKPNCAVFSMQPDCTCGLNELRRAIQCNEEWRENEDGVRVRDATRAAVATQPHPGEHLHPRAIRMAGRAWCGHALDEPCRCIQRSVRR